MPYRQKRSTRHVLRLSAAGLGAAALLGASQAGISADAPADVGNGQRLAVAAPGTVGLQQAPVRGQAQAPVMGQVQAPGQMQAPATGQVQAPRLQMQAPIAGGMVRSRGLPQATVGSQPTSKHQAAGSAPATTPR